MVSHFFLPLGGSHRAAPGVPAGPCGVAELTSELSHRPGAGLAGAPARLARLLGSRDFGWISAWIPGFRLGVRLEFGLDVGLIWMWLLGSDKWLPRKSHIEVTKVSQATTVTKCRIESKFDHLAS